MQEAAKIEWIPENPELTYPMVCKNTDVQPQGVFCRLDQKNYVPFVAIGQEYQLTKKETEQCILIGQKRRAKNLKKQTKNMNYSQRNDEDIHIQGVLGEYVFCKMFGLPIEIYDTTCRNFINDTFDATMPNGWKVDVKTTIYDDADILVSTWKAENPADAYVLMIFTNGNKNDRITSEVLPVLSFRGFVHKSVMFRSGNLKRPGKYGRPGTSYRVPQCELTTWEDMQVDPIEE